MIDYFKLITLIFMIVMCYKIFLMDGTISENFESTPSIADDWNAVNQLAQISRQLMTGTLTVPGSLTITGGSLNIGTTNVGTTLTSLQTQITALTSTVNTNNTTLTNKIDTNYNNTIRVGDPISLTIPDKNMPGWATYNNPAYGTMRGAAGGAQYVSACGSACRGGATLTTVTDAGWALSFNVARG